MKLAYKVHRGEYKNYIESNPAASLSIPVIKRYFKQYKIIVIIRDGIDYVRSAYSKFNPDNNNTYFYARNEPIDRLKAPDFPADPWATKWDKMTRFERICWVWVALNSYIEQEVANDENCILIRFEDIFSKDDVSAGIKEVIGFLELQSEMRMNEDVLRERLLARSNRNKEYLLPKDFAEWNQEFQAAFIRIAGEFMESHGYSLA